MFAWGVLPDTRQCPESELSDKTVLCSAGRIADALPVIVTLPLPQHSKQVSSKLSQDQTLLDCAVHAQ